VATLSTMFATRYGGDAELSSALVAVSTLLSIFTMTGVVGLAALLA
jgi:predicted permease